MRRKMYHLIDLRTYSQSEIVAYDKNTAKALIFFLFYNKILLQFGDRVKICWFCVN